MSTPRLASGVGVVALSPTHVVVDRLVLRDLPLGGLRALHLLDGTRSRARIAKEAHVDEGWLREALDILAEHGLLATERTQRVGVIGSGRLALGLADLLEDEGIEVARTEPSAGWRSLGLVAVAPDRVQPDRVVLDRLMRDDVPHLVLLPEADGAVVGPFVVPGRSACVGCIERARAQQEPEWARITLAAQRAAAFPGPVATAWATGLAAAQVLAWLDGRVPDGVGTTWHLTAGGSGARRWEPRPDCGCQLAPAVAPGLGAVAA